MPIHDWTRVDAGMFHDFHQGWIVGLRDALNAGRLPPEYFAMAEQVVGSPIPDVLTLAERDSSQSPGSPGGLAMADVKPQAKFIMQADKDIYANRATTIVIRHRRGRVVAVIEIVSQGNKSSQNALFTFVEKAHSLLSQGVHLLVVDLFPPSRRDPNGIHGAIWNQVQDDDFELPADKQLTVAAYCGSHPITAYVEPIAIGDVLPGLPVFLSGETYVPAPLEETYATEWGKLPRQLRELFE